MSEKVSKKDQFIAHFMQLPKADLSSAHQAIREEALQALTQLEFPTLRDEHWKYTRVAGILKGNYNLQETKIDALPEGIEIEDEANNLLVFANGFFQPHLSSIPEQEGVSVMTTDQARIEEYDQIDMHYAKHADHQSQIFTALNTAFNHTGAFIRIEKNVELAQPIQIVDISTGEQPTFQPRNLFIAEQGSKAAIIHRFIGNDVATSFINGVSEIVVHENANLNYWMLEQHASNEQHIQTTQVYQERNSNFKTGTFTFGGKLVRNDLNIAVNGEGCETHLNGISLTDGNMHVDHHTVVDHLKPHCESNENYKGILSGKSTGVFNGKVFVRPDAQKINAFQNNQNILLSDDATINSKPELEIYADDVKCSHGSTTGELDEEALFYLQSRGVNPTEAKKMMINAFADEALAVIDSDAIRHHIEQIIANRCEEL
jgi:Fe-S cluster assembly protein SufD